MSETVAAPMTVADALALGIRQQQSGDLERAEQIYRIILSEAPAHPDALHLLGLVRYQAGSFSESAGLIRQAIALDPGAGLFHINLGNSLQAAGQFREAEDAFREAVKLLPACAAAYFNLGNTLKMSGRIQEAVDSYRTALQLDSRSSECWNNLGLALEQLNRLPEAVNAYKLAYELNASAAEALLNLGGAQCKQGLLREAASTYKRAIGTNPSFAEAYTNLGVVLELQKLDEEAEQAHRCAIAVMPDCADAYANLAALLLARQRFAEAAEAARKAIQLRSGHATAHLTLGRILWAEEKLDDAIPEFERAAALAPCNPQPLIGLGIALKDKGRFAEAIENLRRAVALDSSLAEGWSNLAVALEMSGAWQDGIDAYRRALQLKPTSGAARLGLVMAQLPILYTSQEQMAERRVAYAAELAQLQRRFEEGTPHERSLGAAGVGFRQPFLLAYQGQNDRELQRTYGRLICDLMAECHPCWVSPVPMPPLAPGERVRVGIVSGFFHNHSNWKVPIKGWVEQLDKSRFQLFGYYTRARRDANTAVAAASFDTFVQGPLPLEFWCEAIRKDRLHALIFPEIGMDPVTARLAALRLAPVQITSWGHPETSGMPTIDFFLSSDLMEPDCGQDFYTERLVCLPNLSVYYTPPEFPEIKRSRNDFGIREDAIVYWCCQSLYKYQPQHDNILPMIASEVPNSQFVFISHKQEVVNRIFRDRMERAFAAFGLDFRAHITMLRPLSSSEFGAVAHLSDVFLDSIGWSGCNTTLESLEANLPVVTMAGETMRSRHSAGFLRMMGVTESIAETLSEYVAIAVRLGVSAEDRQRLSADVRQNRDKLYRDRETIDALEHFLVSIATDARPSG